MLQVTFIRNNTALVKERLAIRNFKELDLVDTIVSLDDERKKLQFEFDETQSKINAASKEIELSKQTGQNTLELFAQCVQIRSCEIIVSRPFR